VAEYDDLQALKPSLEDVHLHSFKMGRLLLLDLRSREKLKLR